MSDETQRVIQSLLRAPKPDRVSAGDDVVKDTDLSTNTVDQILSRLELEGWLVSAEQTPPEKATPPRRLYRLTELGLAEAMKAGDNPITDDAPDQTRWKRLAMWQEGPDNL